MGLKDIKVPADPSDQQTTEAKSALPPIEFTVAAGATSNILTIQDRQGVQDRLPTKSYRTYFLPVAFAPGSVGSTATVPRSQLRQTVLRASGQKMANLVADTAAPGFGSALTVQDSVNFGQAGYYYCVAVNRAGVEAPPEHIVSTDDLGISTVGMASSTSGGGGGVVPITFTATVDSSWAGTITGAINGINLAFTMTSTFGTTDLVFVDGIVDPAATAIGLALTAGTPPNANIAVAHLA